jgi:DNA polymerase-3 subunit alpha
MPRDTGRVLGMPYGEVDAIAKLIPAPVQGRHIPLAKSIVEDADLSREYNGNPRAKNLIDIAMQLEGTIRNAGTHAAGVVIAPEAIVERVPLTRASKGGIATQYTMGPVEELGLLKFDFLGLSNLTVIKNTLRIMRKVYNVEIDPSEIPLDDKKTFELLAHADTTGVFQLESSGMKRYLRELKPDRFEDIIAMCALYRPGPLSAGLTDSFVRRKNGLEEVTYDHPSMESSLKTTYGVLVYQEQVMQFTTYVCGFTGGEADTMRKSIGKNQVETMSKMKVAFIDGGVFTQGTTGDYGAFLGSLY